MNKIQTILNLEKAGVIAVIRAKSAEEAVKASVACVEGGVVGIEVTYTTPDAGLAIKELVARYKDNEQVVIGAGTVLDSVTSIEAINAGAAFVVSPCFDEESAKLCNLYQIPYLPGCLTPTEIKNALQFGVDVVKLFPGSAFSPSYVKNIKAPLPQANIMPTGGVNLENMADWFAQGVFAVGIGGDLMAPLVTGDFDGVREKARAYHEKLVAIKANAK